MHDKTLSFWGSAPPHDKSGFNKFLGVSSLVWNSMYHVCHRIYSHIKVCTSRHKLMLSFYVNVFRPDNHSSQNDSQRLYLCSIFWFSEQSRRQTHHVWYTALILKESSQSTDYPQEEYVRYLIILSLSSSYRGSRCDNFISPCNGLELCCLFAIALSQSAGRNLLT